MPDQIELTPEQLVANPAVRGLVEAAVTAALRAADTPAPGQVPGGSVGVPNFNRQRPQRLSFAKAIQSMRNGSWTGNELERDFAQATRALYGGDEPSSFAYPRTHEALSDVFEQAAIRTETSEKLREWAVRVAGEGTGSAGGYLVPPQYLQDQFVLSLQTAVAVANAPGVDEIPVNTNLVYLPRETLMPGASGYAEAATLSPTDPTFGQQAITIKKVADINRFSNELLADSTPAYEAYIGKSLARSVALKEDYYFLEGTGSGAAILGLGSYTGLTTAGATGSSWSKGGTATTIGTDYPKNMIYLARAANWEPNCWIMHPRTLDSLSKVKDSTGRYVFQSAGGVFGAPVVVPGAGSLSSNVSYTPGPWKAMLYGLPVLLSTAIPINEATGSAQSHVYLGDFNFAKVLRRQAIELAIADQIYFTTDQTAVRVSTRSALALTVPAAFMKQSGINA